VPPFVGVAVKVTEVPAHISFADPEIDTEGTGTGRCAIVMLLLVTMALLGQTAFEAISTVTTSPLFSVDEIKVALFVPAFEPLIFH
jgi:hypothetical protein